MVRILIYEDNESLRDALVEFLEVADGIQFMGAFPNCRHVRQEIEELQPHVVLMDIDMPIVNGLQGLLLIKKHFPEVSVLMLTVFDDNENVFKAVSLGADGYLLKHTPPERISAAIHEVMQGEAPMSGSIARRVLQLFPKTIVPTQRDSQLTDKERQVLALLVKGHTYKSAASELGNSVDTIRAHIRKIYEKLRVHSMSEAVAKALMDKLV